MTSRRRTLRTRLSAVLVDAHVHLHSCFQLEDFLSGATTNILRAAAQLGLDPSTPGLLILTAGTGEPSVRSLRKTAAARSGSEWTLVSTRDELSLIVLQGGEARLVLVAGRQIRTAEALEVLALGCEVEVPDDLPITDTVERVRSAGALSVVPWGWGKWWFRRGRLLAELLEGQDPTDFFVGDNGGRAAGLPHPTLFARAERLGIRNLPGSDPLPFSREVDRAGSRGFALHAPLDLARPAENLVQLLRDRSVRLQPYGAGERLSRFARNQLAMQLRKWGARRRP